MFFLQWVRIRKWVNSIDKNGPDSYQFKFDDDGIYYKAEKFNTEMKWEYFSSFEVNAKNEAIYLYSNSKNLVEIILKRLVGETHFTEILNLVEIKLKKRYD